MAAFEEAVKTLVDMGFSEEQSREALQKVSPPSVEAAVRGGWLRAWKAHAAGAGSMQWLVENEDKEAKTGEAGAGEDAVMKDASEGGDNAEADKSEAAGDDAPKVVRSYRCVETGKLFRTMQDAQLYAERTGKANFEETDVEVPPLTEEEKKEKLAQLRQKIEDRRKQRAEEEKQAELEREKNRRKGGQEMAEIREEHERLQRERDYAKRKKEKEMFLAEKARLRKEVAKDKADRAADAATRRGASAEEVRQAYQAAYDRAMGKGTGADSAKSKAASAKPPEERMDGAITDLLGYRAGGDGIRAIKTLSKMVGNLIAQPDEPKFKQINLKNEAFKKRVASLIGGVQFLKACGFTKNEMEGTLVLADADYNSARLTAAQGKLDAALAMIRVRLTQDLDLRQKKGDVIEVAAGYGRAYLVANGFAELFEEEKHNDWDPRPMSEAESMDKGVVLEEFKRQMFDGGLRKWSISGLNRVFDAVSKESQDAEGNADLEPWQFSEAINKFGVFLDDRAMATLLRAFDTSGNGKINYREFMTGLRGPMNERRHAIVARAWDVVTQSLASDEVRPDDVVGKVVTADRHPQVEAGQATASEIEAHHIQGLGAWATVDGRVDQRAFFNHFTDVSSAVDSDDIFVSMIEKQFGVREKPVAEDTRNAVAAFQRALLDKLHQKSFQGSSQQRTLLHAFQLVNSDSLGSITLSEFSAAMQNFGFHGDAVEQVFAFFDKSQDNKISYKEFVDAMLDD
ncbi:Crustacean calcium-binding protein 23 (CCBP-23) [Durusdinium trenchii]|uniref:Crustacean calcium-binding protein 23 (CCBP-23) n=1 Tax=Durusdinium trenchii TaxID=1381693 RepID=A0ABP0RHC5_9DINO